jgi:hypothetical protein
MTSMPVLFCVACAVGTDPAGQERPCDARLLRRPAVMPPFVPVPPGCPGKRARNIRQTPVVNILLDSKPGADAGAPPLLRSSSLRRSSRQAGPANLLAYRDMPSTCKELRDHSRYARLVRAKWTCGDSRRRIHLVAHSSRCSDAQGSRVWFAMARHASAAHGVR